MVALSVIFFINISFSLFENFSSNSLQIFYYICNQTRAWGALRIISKFKHFEKFNSKIKFKIIYHNVIRYIIDKDVYYISKSKIIKWKFANYVISKKRSYLPCKRLLPGINIEEKTCTDTEKYSLYKNLQVFNYLSE